jgi:hypothetical protein
MKIKIGWVLRETPCFDEYLGPEISVSIVWLVYQNYEYFNKIWFIDWKDARLLEMVLLLSRNTFGRFRLW